MVSVFVEAGRSRWKQAMLEGCFASAPKTVDRDKASQGSTWTEKAPLHPGRLDTVSKDPGWMTGWIPQSAWPNLEESNKEVRAHPMNCLSGGALFVDGQDDELRLASCRKG